MTFEEMQRDHPEDFESAFKRIKHEALARMLDRLDDPNALASFDIYAPTAIGDYIYSEFDKAKAELEKELA